MIESFLTTFVCKCKKNKKHRLKLDSGSSGFYIIQLCDDCYLQEDRRFVLEEEVMN